MNIEALSENEIFELVIDSRSAVEIDECLVTHIQGVQMWVVGIFDRGTNDVKLILVENNRTANNLENIILAHVYTTRNDKTIVLTDGWLGYSRLSRLNYEHKAVNHQEGYLFYLIILIKLL